MSVRYHTLHKNSRDSVRKTPHTIANSESVSIIYHTQHNKFEDCQIAQTIATSETGSNRHRTHYTNVRDSVNLIPHTL